MVFSDFTGAQSVFLWATFGVAVILGAVVNKTNFCTMGAVSDLVNIGDSGRMRAWVLAIAVAMLGVVILEATGVVNASSSFPPYRGSRLIWAENLLGGVMFGIGMTLASGCGNKTLIRIGGGNLKSIIVLAVISVIAYFMIYPLPGSDQTLMSLLFYKWMSPLAIELKTNQDLGSLIYPKNALMARTVLGSVIALAILIVVFKSRDFRSSFDNILGGLVVGAVILAGWYISSSLLSIHIGEEKYSLLSYAQNWDFLADSAEGKPAEIRSLAAQSFTFINPMGQTLGYAMKGFAAKYLTFGIMAVFGVAVGSLLWSVLTRSFRIEWFVDMKDLVNHVIGAVLMGFGGVLAVGCTIGQGVTGTSTLALGSIIALVSIIFGSAITMKIQLYKMVYEDAGFISALITGMVDMRLLPKGMRKLEAV